MTLDEYQALARRTLGDRPPARPRGGGEGARRLPLVRRRDGDGDRRLARRGGRDEHREVAPPLPGGVLGGGEPATRGRRRLRGAEGGGPAHPRSGWIVPAT